MVVMVVLHVLHWVRSAVGLARVGEVDADAMAGEDACCGLGFRVGARMFSHSCGSLRCDVVASTTA